MAVRIKNTICFHSSARAIKVRLPKGRELWVPQSAVDDDSEVWKAGDHGDLVIADWLAEREGLDHEEPKTNVAE